MSEQEYEFKKGAVVLVKGQLMVVDEVMPPSPGQKEAGAKPGIVLRPMMEKDGLLPEGD